ncbi:Short-chain dehydrogenase [Conexivisphaera calida]|uniref:Short-chain dehydrogenase n=1 Tax=Conexivisphaera calida TaxID=1874277 RepID=A0A4P2VCV1_9ARCH|nr:Short-chain dehydrogenase [Conexivisphaera calida]
MVLITGASSGIGGATTSLLARSGFTVFGGSRRPPRDGASEFEWIHLDVTSDESVRSCVSTVLERAGRIDFLVNNAGTAIVGAIEETPIEDAEALFETNFFGMARMVNAVLPSMRRRRSGLIVNVGSMSARVPLPFHGYMSASKAAVSSYSDALRLELRPLGIRVTVVEPGMVATHPGAAFDSVRVGEAIEDYSSYERVATSIYEEGQNRGSNPEVVAAAILRAIRSGNPARYYLVGGESWLVRAAGLLPPSAVEALMARRFRLPGPSGRRARGDTGELG